MDGVNLYERYKDRLAELSKAMVRKQNNYRTMIEELDQLYSGNHACMEGSAGYLRKTFPQSHAGGRLRLSPQPFLKRLINARATLFHRRPGWILKREESPLPPDDGDALIFRRLRKELKLDLRCRQLQRKDELFNAVFARVAHRLGKLKIDVLKPSLVEVIESKLDPADLQDAECIAVTIDADTKEIWEKPSAANGFQWTYGVVDFNSGKQSDPLFGGSFVNGYEMYPFVVFSHEPGHGIYGVVDQGLLEAQINVDLLESWADFQFRLGFSVAVITTMAELGKDEVPISPDMAIALKPGGQESFTRVPSGLDTGQLTHYVEAKIKRFAAMSAVDPDILASDGKQFLAALTGRAKMVDRMDLTELREDAEIPYEEYLTDFFNVIRVVYNWHRSGAPLGMDLELELEWLENAPPENRLQEAQADQMDVETGALNEVDVRAKRKGISTEEAARQIQAERP